MQIIININEFTGHSHINVIGENGKKPTHETLCMMRNTFNALLDEMSKEVFGIKNVTSKK